MELVTLNAEFLEDNIFEDYSSLIWSERYNKAGDFELRSGSVAETLTALPRGTVVSLSDSTVPMMVETHKIEKPKNSGPVITVYGRSFEAIVLELRASVKDSILEKELATPWSMEADKESDAAYKVMRVVFGDSARYQGAAQVLPAVSPAASPLDAVPVIDLVLPADYSQGLSNDYEIKADNLYTTVMELIATNHHGIKAFRPTDSNAGKIGVEIYNGADLTSQVMFDVRFDQFDGSTYLLSQQGSKNVAYVLGSDLSQIVLKNTAPEPSGLDRRVLLLDIMNDPAGSTPYGRRTAGLIELYKYNATALFDGQISESIASGYNIDYFLGDIVQLVGEYGLVQNVRVSEFIRSSDSTGIKSYPAFEAVDE